MKLLKIFVSGIIAGICIAIGGTAFLVTMSMSPAMKIFGSMLFSVGLLLVLATSTFLYTGKIGYVFKQKANYIKDLMIGLLGNFVGAAAIGYALRLSRNAEALGLVNNSTVASNARLDDNLLSLFIGAVLCGFLVYMAVDSYRQEKWPGAMRVTMVIMCIGTFVVCGLEHVIANIFFISLANAWTWYALLGVIVVAIGNSIGAWIMPFYNMLNEKKVK